MKKKTFKYGNNFRSERDGQIEFFGKFGITDTELSDNTDGIYNGNIFEFKLNINNINIVLFQAVKYLNHMRIKGVSIPANILLVDLNQEVAYLFNSQDFARDYINCPPFIGAASRGNDNFSTAIKPEVIKYDKPAGIQRITELLQTNDFTKVIIDIYDVVGWSNRFYAENPRANKIKLFEEFRKPKYFKKLIYPWKGKEKDFKYIMDLLNDRMHRKELGAFYTPPAYCKKATELVRKAIAQIPKNHNYIILDRCAGTGNLLEFLTDKPVNNITISELRKYLSDEFVDKYLKDKKDVFPLIKYSDYNQITIGKLEKYKTKINIHDYIFDDELSHTIVNTYELKEWIVLNERIGNKVKMIIPPPREISGKEALVNGGDALSEEFILGKARIKMSKEYANSIAELNNFVKNKKTNVILFENPPFRDTASNSHTIATKGYTSYVKEELRGELKGPALNDLSNLFISSAYRYYLNKPDDYYILFSPIKYWKSLGLGEHKFIDGYLFNRAHFHAGPAAIACILWQNLDESREELALQAYDIDTQITSVTRDTKILPLHVVKINKVHNLISKLYDKYETSNSEAAGVLLELDGTESQKQYANASIKPIFNKSIVGYLVSREFGFDHPRLATTLVRCGLYDGHGFFIHNENYLEKLPLFAAGKYDSGARWWEKGTIFKTSDGGDAYTRDTEFLKSCLIYACLSYFNKCRSFEGTDGRFYRNELCFDGKTLATEKLKSFNLSESEKELSVSFKEVLKEAKKTENYNPKYTYGTYQIDNELNTSGKDENETIVYTYPQLNTKLFALKTKLNKYYETQIQSKLFKYQLLK
jgi:hypothetical protein